MRLLLIEDHDALGGQLAAHFEDGGITVTWCRDGSAALASLAQPHDAVLLDLGLPDMDGLDILTAVRAAAPPLPVLILTARDGVEQRIAGLDAGADDYILKPFSLPELEARLRAVMRRPGPRQMPQLGFGDVQYDPRRHCGSVNGRTLTLTRREARLLEELLRGGDAVVVRDALADALYGTEGEASGNAMEAIVSRLRRKLAVLQSRVQIDAIRGIGYRLRDGA